MTSVSTEYFSWSRLFLWLILISLSLFGLCYIYSTGYIGDEYPVRENWQRQFVFLLAGGGLFFLFSHWDNRRFAWHLLVWGGYLSSLLALILVLFIGKEVGGARRWLELGPFLIQPAEAAKVFTILAFCFLLNHQTKHSWLLRLATILPVLLVPALLIQLEPALGNALLLLPPCLAVLLVKSCPQKLFLFLLCVAFLFTVASITGLFWLRSQAPANKSLSQALRPETGQKPGFLHGYHLKRLHSYVSGQGSWNERQSIMTVASGGLKGKGFLNGTMKSLGYLPRTVAPTDFIFSVIAEEGGFLFGSLPVLLLYAFLLLICLYWGATAANALDCSLCTAYSTLILLHILVGIGMTIRLLPIIGLPLPLLSYGGSFTVSFLLGLGCVAGTRMHRSNLPETDSRSVLHINLGRLFQFRLNRF
ncbi:MAG: FtsW/RodA/SpoVE family cell cycle protein [Lentisphaeria bacterium]